MSGHHKNHRTRATASTTNHGVFLLLPRRRLTGAPAAAAEEVETGNGTRIAPPLPPFLG